MRSEPVRVKHGFPPVYDGNSKVLVLGSMPSPRSRERGFYYMHPQNRFWSMLADVLGEELPADICAVFTTGKKAQALYERFFPELPPAVCLPSTSPANRTISEERMLAEYRRIATALESRT